MKKRLIAVLMLTLAMLLLTAQAGGALTLDPKTTKVTKVTLDATGTKIIGIDAEFQWSTIGGFFSLASADVTLVVLDKNVGKDELVNQFKAKDNLADSIGEVCSKTGANKIAISDKTIHVDDGKTYNPSFDMNSEGNQAISLNGSNSYYIYLWTRDYWGDWYPDALLGEMNVNNGKVTFNSGEKAENVTSEQPETKPEDPKPEQPEEKPETKPEEKPTTEVKKAAESMPKTGDESLPLLYLALGLGCCAALVAMKRRKA